VVGGPYGAVKEQSSGLYAQTMAERGFIAIAHDPSYNGESGGQPHFTASFEALLEDFSAAVDFLRTKSFVDRERIGVIGICGSGSFGLAAAETDPRIKAVATVSMYDIGQAHRQGLAENADTAALKKNLAEISKQRWAEVDGAERTMVIGTPQKLTEKSSAIVKEFYDYYRTPRGQHPRSSTAFWRTSGAQMMLFWSFENSDWISPRPVLFITGDRAHSRIFSEHAFKKASEPKELFIVPIGLTKSAALDYAQSKIRINAVCPGIIDTPMMQRFTGGTREGEQRVIAQEPVARMGTPEEIAAAAVWLCSDSAAFVVGHAMVIDGGQTV
jgi:fermentation-respiration switch protein FrsA (DUF1100 family)